MPLATWKAPQLGPWQRFRRNPAEFLAQWLWQQRPRLAPETRDSSDAIIVVCISDTHCTQPAVPDGDILLHAGDLTNAGTFEELQSQLDWLGSLPHKHKVIVAGNHDRLLDPKYLAMFPDRICETEGASRADLKWHDIVYLYNSSTTLSFANGRRLNIFGSPSTPICGVFAFQYPPIRNVWKGSVPEDTDILLTHGPPRGYLDRGGKGCPHLMREVAEKRPRAVVFGHIHTGHGREEISFDGVERGYQKVMVGDGGLGAVFTMAFWLLVLWIADVVRSATVSTETRSSRTTMVNASVVGGPNGQGYQAVRLEL